MRVLVTGSSRGIGRTVSLELGHFGVHVVLVEPGAVASGALDAPRRFFGSDDPYLPLARERRFDPARMSDPQAVAEVVPDALENPTAAFRWRVGEDAEQLLAARAKLDDHAFEGVLRSALSLTW